MPGATVATTLNTQAMPVPSAISVNMLRLRVRSEFQPLTKKGHPAQSTTGVAKRSCSQLLVRLSSMPSSPRRCAPISSATTGRASGRPIAKRPDMSASSGLGPASPVTRSGSSAMPQMGQAPGLGCLTSGCIGQV